MSDNISVLNFKRASYRLEKGLAYSVRLNWEGHLSNELELVA